MSNDDDDDDTAQMTESAPCTYAAAVDDDRWSMRTRIVGSLLMHVTFRRVQICTKERNFNLTFQMVLFFFLLVCFAPLKWNSVYCPLVQASITTQVVSPGVLPGPFFIFH